MTDLKSSRRCRGWLIPGVFLLLYLGAGSEPLISNAEKQALILIDIQNFYFKGGKIPLVGGESASRIAGRILGAFRKKKLPVIHVKHEPAVEKTGGKPLDSGWDFHKNVLPVSGEPVFIKHDVNGFLKTGLKDFLNRNGIKTVVICGMQTHMCLEAAARAAHDLGFSVVVVQDACATRDLEFQGISVPAHLVQASTLSTLAAGYSRIVSGNQLLHEMEKTRQ